MPRRRDILCGMMAGLLARPASAVPAKYMQVWSDEFTNLSLRKSGSGTWSSPGAWYSTDSRGVEGYGYDWFVDPFSNRWPEGYHGQITKVDDGVRIRAEVASPQLAQLLPSVKGAVPWLSGQINSFYAVRIKPPFYFEAKAKMPVSVGNPWPAIWLMTGAKNNHIGIGQEYEIDVHEGFGDSNKLHSAIHWNPSSTGKDYKSQSVVEMPVDDLSADFNTWGCHVTRQRQEFFFNGVSVGAAQTPANAQADQHYGIMLDVSAGIPWDKNPPSGGPHDMVVRFVKLYAPNTRGLITQ